MLILQRLRKQFPKIQFFTTTHTPLTAAGIADVDSGMFVRFDSNDKKPTDATVLNRKDYQGIRADQWLESSAFGLATTRSPHTASDSQYYVRLLKENVGKPPTDEIVRLRKRFSEQMVGGESEYEREIIAAVEEVLEKRLKDHPTVEHSESIKLQLTRLLGELAEQL